MGNIIGQPLDGYVAKQIEARQALMVVEYDLILMKEPQINLIFLLLIQLGLN
jgi:hypothetical protein